MLMHAFHLIAPQKNTESIAVLSVFSRIDRGYS